MQSGEQLTVKDFALSIAGLSKANILDVPLYTFLHQVNTEVSYLTCCGVHDAAWDSEVLSLPCILEKLAWRIGPSARLLPSHCSSNSSQVSLFW